MLAIINSCTVYGMEGHAVQVEVDVSNGLPAFDIVGLPDASVRESRERVRTAIKNSGFDFPVKRITVNLAPADLKKEGPLFDLPIAIAILVATEQISKTDVLDTASIVGELSLEGTVRTILGILPMADKISKEKNRKHFFVPAENAREAALLPNLKVYPIKHLKELVAFLKNEEDILPAEVDVDNLLQANDEVNIDMGEVRGQEGVKRALEVAAAGGHNMVLIGSPGSGKTMLARRLPSILPRLDIQESLDITKIYSIAGLLPKNQPLITKRPFRSPHHSASMASLIGGGKIPRPGEISLASHGILFLDEMAEYHKNVLEALRQPLEDRIVTISRVAAALSYPAKFQLVGALNPCPCGFFGDPVRECTCTPHQIQKYMGKISGPLLDRMDIHMEVPRVEFKELSNNEQPESSAKIRGRVELARQIQTKRFTGTDISCNAYMGRKYINNFCKTSKDAQDLLESAFARLNMSARAYDRVLKVARTIADLDGAESIDIQHIAEAIQFRSLDRKYF